MTTPICAHFVIPRLILKTQAAIPKIWRKIEKIKIGVLWVIKVTRGHQQCYHSTQYIRFPIHLSKKLGAQLLLFSRHWELFVESCKFFSTPRVFCAHVGSGNTGMSSCSFTTKELESLSIILVNLCLAAFTELWLVMNRYIQGHSIYHASIESKVVNFRL